MEPPNLDLPIWSYEIYKTAQKLEFLNYPYELQPLSGGTRVSADPTGQRQRNRGGTTTARHTAKLTDGGCSGESDGTGVLASTNRI